MKYWLVDADNQSVVMVPPAVAVIGWPDKIIMAGRDSALTTWRNQADFPDTVEVIEMVSPPVKDGADVMLAMAAGVHKEQMTSVAIFSRDNLVATTLGAILQHSGIPVLAISRDAHPSLGIPHLTLPMGQGTAADVCYAQHSRGSEETQWANTIMGDVFAEANSPRSITKSNLCNILSGKGYDVQARKAILSGATDYICIGSGSTQSYRPRFP